MWIMTPGGFVSIVHKEGGLQVRARDRKSLEAFCKQAGLPKKRIVADWEEKYRDYPYRVKNVPKSQVKRYLCAEADGITYSNFKNEAKRVRGQAYASILSRVWSNMLSMTPSGVHRAMVAADRKRVAALPLRSSWGSREIDSREADASLDGQWSESWWMTHFGKGAKNRDRDQSDADSDFTDLEDDDDLVAFIDKKIGDMTEDEWRQFQENLASGI